MNVNSDFNRRASVHASIESWKPSPMPGVDRIMLDRVGEEVARATSIVRYRPGSRFSPHIHHGGEEFLVLDGVFQDESGNFPVGSYVRNPPLSRHTPRSDSGCTIFVKLWQFDPHDRVSVKGCIEGLVRPDGTSHPAVTKKHLYSDLNETVKVEYWPADRTIFRVPAGGIEILCLEGSFSERDELFIARSWLRLPPGDLLNAKTGSNGCTVWIKEGHLRKLHFPPAAS